MLYKTKDKASNKTLYHSKPLLIKATDGYVRPGPGKEWFMTTTTVWRIDELVRRRVRDWRRLTGETGHSGERTGTFREDHDSVYTGTHSVFPAPLVEWVLLRYGGPAGGKVLDAFAGGPPRALVASIMGYNYVGVEVRQEQIDENKDLLKGLGLENVTYVLGDGRILDNVDGQFDCALTCPPYHNLEKYSDQTNDLSNCRTYEEFRAGIWLCAHAHKKKMKSGSFICFVVGNFRDKKSGELVDFRAHTVEDFKDAGFIFWQEIILSKNFGSAAKRSTNAWRGLKLVSNHEFLLIFRAP